MYRIMHDDCVDFQTESPHKTVKTVALALFWDRISEISRIFIQFGYFYVFARRFLWNALVMNSSFVAKLVNC